MEQVKTNQGGFAQAIKVSRQSIVVNLLLSLGKLAAGILGRSAAMVSDAVHSASDVFSTLIVMVGLRLARQAEDRDHEYGHERLECVAALLLAAVLAVTGGGIGISGVRSILALNSVSLAVPGLMALWAAVISIAVKEGMYWYTRRAAKQCGSAALMADAWHHRSDALSSVGSLIGIAGARLGFPVLDPVASLVICVFILKAAVGIFRDAVGKLTDHAAAPGLEQEMADVILRQQGVQRLDLLKTRQFGSRIYVDVEFSSDGDLSLVEAHAIAHRVHDSIEREFPSVKHCMVHVNPMET
ncbi:MAG: cation diffusion facilitator family transporter [Candidatus Onthomonas sp.]|nr:cation diffusion facilitator family transporter [Candidatus Onthomonas sp.]